jgi:hypothetical protein
MNKPTPDQIIAALMEMAGFEPDNIPEDETIDDLLAQGLINVEDLDFEEPMDYSGLDEAIKQHLEAEARREIEIITDFPY